MTRDILFQGLPDSGTYSGPCKVTFDSPWGEITGKATLRVSEASRVEAEVTIESLRTTPEYGDNRVAFVNATPPRREGNKVVVPIKATPDERRIRGFFVETEKGTLSATSGLLANPVYFGLDPDETLSLALNDLVFSTHNEKVENYWLMPLQGPFADHYMQRMAQPHRMAMDGESYVPFAVDGRACGLQIFDSANVPKHPLATYDAIAFGELPGPVNTLEEMWTALPRGLDSALSFATGSDITAPWIELRGHDGTLARRFFFRVGHRSTEAGFAAFSKANEFPANSGIGTFLAAFFAARPDKRNALLVPLNLIRSGAPGSNNIDNSITDLVKALDILCEAHGLTTQNLLGRLDEANRKNVMAILAAAKDKLFSIRSENQAHNQHDQADVLSSIVSRLANVATSTRNFGMAVKDLLTILSLQDAEIFDRYYRGITPQTTSWTELLSAVRGEVVHRGFLRIEDRRALHSWFEFARHLHDLCTRVILTELKYSGFYQASTNPWQDNYSVDRVTSTMNVKDLGFSAVPAHI